MNGWNAAFAASPPSSIASAELRPADVPAFMGGYA
jgi:hypothetical protein